MHLDLPPEFLDVNVHPQKAEVRFADPRALADALYGMLSRALGGRLLAADAEPQRLGPLEARAGGRHRASRRADGRAAHRTRRAQLGIGARSDVNGDGNGNGGSGGTVEPGTDSRRGGECHGHRESSFERVPALLAARDSAAIPVRSQPEITWSNLKFVAQLRQTFLLCESADGIYLLDQHAAAERVTFTRLRKQYQGRAVPSQALLFPVILDVLPTEAELRRAAG